MQRKLPRQLSIDSRNILYIFKQTLFRYNLTLKPYLLKIHNKIHQRYNYETFLNIILKAQRQIKPFYIQQLFKQLDILNELTISFEWFESVYQKIDYRDNPQEQIVQINQYETMSQYQLLEVYKDIILLFGFSQESLEILEAITVANKGCVTRDNFINLFRNDGFRDHYKITVFLQKAFQQRSKITIGDILKQFDALQQQHMRRMQMQIEAQRVLKSELVTEVPNPQSLIEFQLEEEELGQGSLFGNRKYQWSYEEQRYVRDMLLFQKQKVVPHSELSKNIQRFFNEDSEIEDIFAQIVEKHLKNNLDFVDLSNPSNKKALSKLHITSKFHDSYCLFNQNQAYILRQKRQNWLQQLISSKDIKQGNIGSCYFLTAIVSLSHKYPELIHRLFVLKKNPAHLYGVRLFVQGKWKTFMLDASFPLGRGNSFCCTQPSNREIWVMLLEKAWAKAYGSYDKVEGGLGIEGLSALSGAPSKIMSTKHPLFINIIEIYLQKGATISCGSSKLTQLSQKQQQMVGIYNLHGYSILSVHPNVIRQQRTFTLIRLRNPWGHKEWQGDWSFNSNLWTTELRQQFDYERHPKDGSFFMQKFDFTTYFQNIFICYIIPQHKNTHIQFNPSTLDFQTTNIVIKKKGIYMFTLYQEHPRRYLASQQPQKSQIGANSSMFLLRSKGGKKIAVDSSFHNLCSQTIMGQYEPGPYILFAKVHWQKEQEKRKRFTLSCYGPERPVMKKLQKWNENRLEQFLSSVMEKDQYKIPMEKDPFYNVERRMVYNIIGGYGYYSIRNIGDVSIRWGLIYNNPERMEPGYSLLPPHQLPLLYELLPGQNMSIKCLIHDTTEQDFYLDEKIDPIF